MIEQIQFKKTYYLPVRVTEFNHEVGDEEPTVRLVNLSGRHQLVDFEQNIMNELVEIDLRIDQPKPVVPKFVAEYIERCKRSDCGLIWAIRPDRGANDNSEEVYDWLFPNGVKLPNGMFPNPYEPDNLVRPDKENQIKFVRAWLDGYTVEKEKFYTVEIPNPNGCNLYLIKLDKEVVITSDVIADVFPDNLQLTEQEIRKDFDWAFRWAKEVTE